MNHAFLGAGAAFAVYAAPAMDPFAVIARHYRPGEESYRVLVAHSVLVASKAIELARARRLRVPAAEIDLAFLEEIALLHDIGIRWTHAPEIGCAGAEPYIRHGIIGREVLEKEGLPRHALACERHTGAGIPRAEVIERDLPLPQRDFLPVTLEEKVLCVADKFYSKKPGRLWRERSPEEVSRTMTRWGERVAERWRALWEEVCGPAAHGATERPGTLPAGNVDPSSGRGGA